MRKAIDGLSYLVEPLLAQKLGVTRKRIKFQSGLNKSSEAVHAATHVARRKDPRHFPHRGFAFGEAAAVLPKPSVGV